MNLEAKWIGELHGPLRTAMLWAWQTIVYAMSKRASDVGADIMEPRKQRAMGEESLLILREMYERARDDAPDKRDLNDLVTRVARQVIDWAVSHVKE